MMRSIFLVMLYLVSLVLPGISANAFPALGTVTPSSGSITIGQWTTVTSTYSDSNGASKLATCSLLLNNSLTNIGGAHFFFDQNANKLFMKNNAGAVIGGYAPYSSNTIESENAVINCAASSVKLSGNTITVAWRIMLKPTIVRKTCNVYMLVQSDAGASVGWTVKGVIYANSSPVAQSVSPASGNVAINQWKVFTCKYSDADGAGNLATGSLLINNAIVNMGGCHFFYNENQNKLYMKNNSDLVIGGFAPGSSNLIESENAILSCSGTSVAKSGNILTVNFRVMLKPTMNKKTCDLYMMATDDWAASYPWTSKGKIYAYVNSNPVVQGVSPASGTVTVNQWSMYTCVYSDVDGARDIATCGLLINNALTSKGGGYFYYDENQNRLYMKNNAGAFIGGFAPGSANRIQSENAILDCAGTTVGKSGNNVTIKWRFQLYTPLAGKKCSLYMQATDDSGGSAPWVSKGSVSVVGSAAVTRHLVVGNRGVYDISGTYSDFDYANLPVTGWETWTIYADNVTPVFGNRALKIVRERVIYVSDVPFNIVTTTYIEQAPDGTIYGTGYAGARLASASAAPVLIPSPMVVGATYSYLSSYEGDSADRQFDINVLGKENVLGYQAYKIHLTSTQNGFSTSEYYWYVPSLGIPVEIAEISDDGFVFMDLSLVLVSKNF